LKISIIYFIFLSFFFLIKKHIFFFRLFYWRIRVWYQW